MSEIRRTEDDVLVRYLDGEPLPGDPAVTVTATDPSADRLWELREASDDFSALLAHLPVSEAPPPRLARSRPTRRGLRAAVVALLAFGGAAAAMPTARSRILGALEAVISRDSTPASTPGVGATTVTFVPVSDGFTIEVRSTQSVGALVVVRASTPAVTAETSGPADLLVLPSGLVVANPPTSNADVLVRLPESISELRVTVAGIPIETSPLEPGAPLRIPLTVRGR